MTDSHHATQKQGRATANKELIDTLRDELIAKLTEDWSSKWAKEHGFSFDGIDNVPSQEAFFNALREDIQLTIAEKWISREALTRNVSNDTLGRFFNEAYDKTFTRNTLDVL
ncbi:MAG TPA: hypothetical protein VGB67_06460, partial [Fibrella sp.]